MDRIKPNIGKTVRGTKRVDARSTPNPSAPLPPVTEQNPVPGMQMTRYPGRSRGTVRGGKREIAATVTEKRRTMQREGDAAP